jgi:hypothetical protein
LPAALALLLVACGGKSFETLEPGDGGSDDGAPPADSGPADAGGGDSAKPGDGGQPDVGADTGVPMCPIPATIGAGGRCDTPGLDCMSAAPIYTCGTGQVTGYASCKCTIGVWACPAPTCIEGGAPPPSCPNPQLVRENVPCATPGEQCPGNPTLCGTGVPLYDVFQCSKTQLWTRSVATVCADGG